MNSFFLCYLIGWIIKYSRMSARSQLKRRSLKVVLLRRELSHMRSLLPSFDLSQNFSFLHPLIIGFANGIFNKSSISGTFRSLPYRSRYEFPIIRGDGESHTFSLLLRIRTPFEPVIVLLCDSCDSWMESLIPDSQIRQCLYDLCVA